MKLESAINSTYQGNVIWARQARTVEGEGAALSWAAVGLVLYLLYESIVHITLYFYNLFILQQHVD